MSLNNCLCRYLNRYDIVENVSPVTSGWWEEGRRKEEGGGAHKIEMLLANES
jgi:hypothetical protein